MKTYNKIIVGSIITSALALAPVVMASTAVATPTKSPTAKASVVKKVDPKVEAAKKNKVIPTNPAIIKKMQASEKTKKAAADARMRAEINDLKAKAQAKKVQ